MHLTKLASELSQNNTLVMHQEVQSLLQNFDILRQDWRQIRTDLQNFSVRLFSGLEGYEDQIAQLFTDVEGKMGALGKSVDHLQEVRYHPSASQGKLTFAEHRPHRHGS